MFFFGKKFPKCERKNKEYSFKISYFSGKKRGKGSGIFFKKFHHIWILILVW
jgi:hypothetical protein